MAKQTIVSGDILHASNERVKELEIVIKGSFIATSGSVLIELPYGSVIGLFETPGEKYRFDYEAKEDAMVVSYSYHSEDSIRSLIRSNPQITPMIANAVISSVQSLFEKTAQHMEACREMAEILGTGERMKYDLHTWRNDYFRSIKGFLPSKDIGFCTGTILYAYEYLQEMAPVLSALIEQKSEFDLRIMTEDDYAEEDIGEDEDYTGDEESGVSDDDIENLVEAEGGKKSEGNKSKKVIDEDVSDSLRTILEYSGISEEKQTEFRLLLADYAALRDRSAVDDGVRRIRRQITDLFFEIYEGAFFRSVADRNVPLVLKMFFYFGFVDEGLAGEENTRALKSLAAAYEPDPEGNVLTAYEWLKLIFEGRVEPSKNEFDMEFPKYLKERYENGEIRQDEMGRLANDRKAKTSFEIQNFLKLGSKITFGRVTSYVPIFTESSTVRSPENCVTTHEAVHDTMNMVRGIDFSCFTRQIIYSNTNIGVTREFIDTEIIPYVIIMPNGGSRSALWQEISGAHRDTPGRMMMPAFLDREVSVHVLRLIAEFRWEMCRREQGVRWNDVTTPSLTAFFCDYLQFYRKNHEISVDLREKIKAQLQSARNSSKAVFVSDYMNYIVYESAGSLRLNRVSRDIIFRFCPFSKEIRQRLAVTSPAYQKLIERYDIKLAQRKRLMDIVYTKIEKVGARVPDEIAGQKRFLEK